MRVSPSESPAFRCLGASTWRTEDFGVDAYWVALGRQWGVQRKALSDFCASVQDGRLAKELMQMQRLDVPVLMLETGEKGGGDPREVGGILQGVGHYGRGWTAKQLRGVLWGIADQGVWIERTRDETETIARIKELELWSRKERHASGRNRGVAPKDVFGQRGVKEYGVWLLCSLPGVGPEMAGRIWDLRGGLPFSLDVTREELMSVPGVGRKTAERILDVLGSGE